MVEVGFEIQQLVFEIRARPEQRAIQTLPPYRSDQPLHEGMGQGNVRNGSDGRGEAARTKASDEAI